MKNIKILSTLFLFCAFFSVSIQAEFGWKALPGTELEPHCPENNFNNYPYHYAFSCKNVTRGWSSATYDSKRNAFYIWGGGHGDYYGNEVYALDLNEPAMARITDPAYPVDPFIEPQSELAPNDGTQPNGRHTFDGLTYMPSVDKVWAFSGSLSSRSGTFDSVSWIFDPETRLWRRITAKGEAPKGAIGITSAYDKNTGKIFFHNRVGLFSYTYDDEGGRYEMLNNEGYMGVGYNAEIDTVANRYYIIGNGAMISYNLDPSTGYARTDHALQGDAEFIRTNVAPGLAFHEEIGAMFAWVGDGKVYRYDPQDNTWSAIAFSGGPDKQLVQGTFGRFAYASEQKEFVLVNEIFEPAYVLSIPNIEDVEAPSAPSNLAQTSAVPGGIKLSWEPSTDNFGVAGYEVYVDNVHEQTVKQNSINLMQLAAGARFNVKVRAFDSKQNLSEFSNVFSVNVPDYQPKFRIGDCETEPLLSGRDDIVFCEAWESEDWWSEKQYLNEASPTRPGLAVENSVQYAQITSENCVQGKCLKVRTPEQVSNSLSVFWPLSHAEQAPENLYLRYYIKLGEDWTPGMCDTNGTFLADGGKFPGVADVRTYRDPVNQCGNGGEAADGLNCWSHRSIFGSCDSGDGEACFTKPNAVTRFGSYVYHPNQESTTGDAGYWDGDDWGQSQRNKGTCGTNAGNMYCGRGDGGVMERGIWYRVEMQITMNTPGQTDGVIRGWIDGELSYEKVNMEFRKLEHDFLHNRLIWLGIYKGGVHGNCQDGNIYLDQLVVSLDAPPGGVDALTLNPPGLTFNSDKVDVPAGEDVTLNWQSERAENCVAKDAWEGSVSTNGERVISALQSSSLFSLECSGEGGTSKRQVAVLVDGIPLNAPPNSGGGSASPPPANNIPLDAPEGLSVTGVTDSTFTLSWDRAPAGANLYGYQVYVNDQLVEYVYNNEFAMMDLVPRGELTLSVAAVSTAGVVSPRSENIPIVLASGSVAEDISLNVDADTYLAKSTFRNLGDFPTFDISETRVALLRFPLETFNQHFVLESAVLRVHSDKEYSDVQIDAFAAAKAWTEMEATRDFTDIITKVAWDNANGDFTDLNMTPNGPAPFASVVNEDDNQMNQIELDVTSLVRKWLSGEMPNYGFYLSTASKGTLILHSRESADETRHPELILKGKFIRNAALKVSEDTFLSTTTFRTLGEWEQLELSRSANLLVKFDDVASFKTVQILDAKLNLHTRAEVGPLDDLKVFTPATDWSEIQATRSYALQTPSVKWQNLLGDWIDKNGALHGVEAFNTFSIVDDDIAGWEAVDVTQAMRAWQATQESDFDVFLHSLGSGIVTFHSKESGQSELAPWLEVTYSQP